MIRPSHHARSGLMHSMSVWVGRHASLLVVALQTVKQVCQSWLGFCEPLLQLWVHSSFCSLLPVVTNDAFQNSHVCFCFAEKLSYSSSGVIWGTLFVEGGNDSHRLQQCGDSAPLWARSKIWQNRPSTSWFDSLWYHLAGSITEQAPHLGGEHTGSLKIGTWPPSQEARLLWMAATFGPVSGSMTAIAATSYPRRLSISWAANVVEIPPSLPSPTSKAGSLRAL